MTTPGPEEFRFDCPYCREPWARTVEKIVDIHWGHTYTCWECKGKVIFVTYTVDEYVLACKAIHAAEAMLKESGD